MVGSVILRTEVGLPAGAVAVAAIFALQFVIGRLRARPRLRALFDNTPTLVMRDGRVLHDKLAATRLVEADLHPAMRAANVHRYADVDAIVLEKTGSLSVVHHSPLTAGVEGRLLPPVNPGQREGAQA